MKAVLECACALWIVFILVAGVCAGECGCDRGCDLVCHAELDAFVDALDAGEHIVGVGAVVVVVEACALDAVVDLGVEAGQ